MSTVMDTDAVMRQKLRNMTFRQASIILDLMDARAREVADLGEPGVWLPKRRLLLINRDIDPKTRGELVEQALDLLGSPEPARAAGRARRVRPPDEEVAMRISLEIRAEMVRQEVSATALAEHLGMPTAKLRRKMSTGKLSMSELQMIAGVLEVRVSEFARRADEGRR